MKKFFSFLLTLLTLFFLFVTTFYVFGLRDWVVNIWSKKTVEQTVSNVDEISNEEEPLELPAVLEDDEDTEAVDENLTYEERIKKGNYFLSKGFLSLSTNEFTIASKLEPERIEPLIKLGNIYFLLGEYEKAQLNLQKVLQLRPDDIDSQVLLGKIFVKKNNFESARKYFFAIKGNSALVSWYQGMLAIVDNRLEDAQTSFQLALTYSPDENLKIKIQNFINNYQEYSLYSDGQEVFLKTLLSKSLNEAGEYEMAIQVLKEILKKQSDYRDAWILLGYAYLNLEKYDFALTAFDKAYKLDPEKAEIQYFLGLTFVELSKNKEAITFLEVALKNGFEPRIQVLQKLADLYVEDKEYDQAVELYEEILKLNNSDINSYVRPIWIYLDLLNEPTKALDLALQAQSRHPQNAMSYNLVGWAYLGEGEMGQAKNYLAQAIKIDDKLPAPYLNLGKLYEQEGETEKALIYYKKAYELNSDGSVGVLAAQKYNELVNQ